VTNLINYNPNTLKFRVAQKDYWDFYLARPNIIFNPYTGVTNGLCTVAHFDFNNILIYGTGTTSADTIYSTSTWVDAVSTGVTATTVGYTGIDNGMITFDKTSGDTSNQALLSALTASTLVIPSGDTRFMMTRVTGMTEQYEYPISIVEDNTVLGDYADFCGGFYQGYYMLDGYDYKVLPNRYNKGWLADFWLKKADIVCTGTTATTINDTYPDNKGFFFYMGARAENKFWDIFDGINTGCTSGCTVPSGCTGTVTTFCTVPKETDIIMPNGMPLSLPDINFIEIDNQFLIYHRAKATTTHYGISYPEGYTAPEFTGTSITVTATTQVVTNTDNPFLVYCRACGSSSCGCNSGSTCQTVPEFSGFTAPLRVLDNKLDVIDNAIGFRITDDGKIGYRLLSVTGSCSDDKVYTSGITVTEKYTDSFIVPNNSWTNVSVRFFAYNEYNDYELECKDKRLGRIAIYVNGKLKLFTDDFIEFVPRRLNTNSLRQVAVPYNISLGGGSLGLLESMTFDGQDPEDLALNIETNFAGTFIGSISQFRMYGCDLNWGDIENNFAQQRSRYGIGSSVSNTKGIFYGKLNSENIITSQVGILTFLATNDFTGRGITSPSGVGYIYLLLPVEVTQPSEFRNSEIGCEGFLLPFLNQGSVIVPNGDIYLVYRSVYQTLSSVNIWLCN
jgi:hypothetical protein